MTHNPSPFDSPNPHRLYRNPRSGYVSGVCAGIADYFGIQPFLIRLAVVIGIPEAYGLVLVQAHVLAPVPFAFNSLDLLWTLVVILVLAALASAGPVLAAIRVKIVQTLSYE